MFSLYYPEDICCEVKRTHAHTHAHFDNGNFGLNAVILQPKEAD